MLAIHTLHWDEIPAELVRHWTLTDGRCLAIWPAPMNADACFQAAGFCDFEGHDDRPEEWDNEFELIVSELVRHLEEFGPASIREGETPVRARPGLLDRLLWRWVSGRGRLAHWEQPATLLDHLVAPTENDNFPPCVVDFGAGATLRTSDGHEIVWIQFASGSFPSDLGAFLARLAQGRAIKRTTLSWEKLAEAAQKVSHFA